MTTAWSVTGCAGTPCNTDGDCKGGRVCELGACADPRGAGGSGQGGSNSGAGNPTGGGVGDNCVSANGQEFCVQKGNPTDNPMTVVGIVPPPAGGLPQSASVPLGSFEVPNQGSCGSCVAFATRNSMAIRGIQQTGGFTDFSPAHIWHVAGYGSEDCTQGSSIHSVFHAQMNTGDHIVPVVVWPYLSSDPYGSLGAVPSAKTLEDGGIAYIDAAYSVAANSLEDVKAAVAQGWPPVVAVPVYDLSGWAGGNGDVDVPPPGADLDGYHAVALTSYDDATQRFGFVNSWGSGWGNGGYGTMTYAFLQEYMVGGMAPTHLEYKPTPGCNDGKIDPGETCDGNDFGGATCKTLGYDSGTLQCQSCQISTAGCCNDACSTGATQCLGQSQQTCVKPPGQCASWGPPVQCNSGCANGQCINDPCANMTCDSPGTCQYGGGCVNGVCQYQNKPANSTCDDGNPQTQNDVCDGAGNCDGCVTSYSADWVCNTYKLGSGVGQEIFNICSTVAASGQVTIKAKKVDGSIFGVRPYHVEVSNPNDGSCGPSNWFFADVSAPAQGVGTDTLTFTFTPSWLAGQTQKAYCVVASTKSGDPGYDPNIAEQTSWWYSKKVVVTKSCQ